MELVLERPAVYRVRRGQTLADIARAFSLPARLLAAKNSLTGEVEEGQLLTIPAGGNLYRVRGGESCTLLCGSREKFYERNATKYLYPTQEVIL